MCEWGRIVFVYQPTLNKSVNSGIGNETLETGNEHIIQSILCNQYRATCDNRASNLLLK